MNVDPKVFPDLFAHSELPLIFILEAKRCSAKNVFWIFCENQTKIVHGNSFKLTVKKKIRES